MRLYTVVLIFIFQTISYSAEKADKRGMWVVRYAMKDKYHINKIIDTAVNSNITDLYVQVRALGQTYYHSEKERPSDLFQPDIDPLQFIILKAKQHNIRIHAWINMFYIWSGNDLPKDTSHCYYLLSKHILRFNQESIYTELKKQGIEGYFLDPTASETQKYLLEIISEIVKKYEISGIHLDYFRYPNVRYSFTPANRTEYRIRNFIDPIAIYTESEKYADEKNIPFFRVADKNYRSYLIDKLNNYLSEIYTMVKYINPTCEISVAVKPDPVIAKYRYFQNWQYWLENNYCDYVLLMNYRTDLNEFSMILEQDVVTNLKSKIIVGISTYNQNENAVLERIKKTQSANYAGFTLFSYNHLADNRKYFNRLLLSNFSGEKNGL